MERTKSGIYRIVNCVNGHQYVGQSKDIEKRWQAHTTSLVHQYHANNYLQNAWNKYGNNVWEFEILEEGIPSYMLVAKENEYIEKLKPEYNVAKNKYEMLKDVFVSIEDIEEHPIYRYNAHKIRPKWHAWVYGGGRNPQINGSRRRKK